MVKTMQDSAKVTNISISALGQSQLCPWRALKEMLACSTLDQDFSLFQFPSPACAIPVTDSVARKHLKDVSRCLIFQISRPRRPGSPRVGGGIFNCPLLGLLLPLHFVPTCLHDYLSTG